MPKKRARTEENRGRRRRRRHRSEAEQTSATGSESSAASEDTPTPVERSEPRETAEDEEEGGSDSEESESEEEEDVDDDDDDDDDEDDDDDDGSSSSDSEESESEEDVRPPPAKRRRKGRRRGSAGRERPPVASEPYDSLATFAEAQKAEYTEARRLAERLRSELDTVMAHGGGGAGAGAEAPSARLPPFCVWKPGEQPCPICVASFTQAHLAMEASAGRTGMVPDAVLKDNWVDKVETYFNMRCNIMDPRVLAQQLCETANSGRLTRLRRYARSKREELELARQTELLLGEPMPGRRPLPAEAAASGSEDSASLHPRSYMDTHSQNSMWRIQRLYPEITPDQLLTHMFNHVNHPVITALKQEKEMGEVNQIMMERIRECKDDEERTADLMAFVEKKLKIAGTQMKNHEVLARELTRLVGNTRKMHQAGSMKSLVPYRTHGKR